MRMKFFAAAAIAVGATAALTAPAHATTVVECRALVVTLSAQTDEAGSLSNKAEAGLLDKAGAAVAKIDAGKVADALTKLTDFESTLVALHGAPKPKVSDSDFELLKGSVDAASLCVSNIEVL